MFKHNTTVLYHKNCTDGFMSAYLLYRAYKSLGIYDTIYIPINYGEQQPKISTQTLIIIDFSFSRDIIDSYIEKGIDVYLYDHHLTAANQYGGYGRFKCKGFTCCIVEEKSGAGLALDLIKNITSIEEKELCHLEYIALRIEDRDIWKFKYDDTKAVYELLNSIEFKFEKWDEIIFSSTFFTQLEKMKVRVEFRNQLALEYAAKARLVKIKEYEVPCVNVPANFSSEVGAILSIGHPFAIMYVVGEIIYVSLRSNNETGIDTTTISKQFGGGGHINASGFKLEVSQLDNLLKGLL